jgi:hypothetical protein
LKNNLTPEQRQSIEDDFRKKNEEHQTLRTPKQKKAKFSSFGTNKEYNLRADRLGNSNLEEFKPFELKEEFTRIPFDPNVRHRLPSIPNHLTYRYLYGHMPSKEPMSQYVAVNHRG